MELSSAALIEARFSYSVSVLFWMSLYPIVPMQPGRRSLGSHPQSLGYTDDLRNKANRSSEFADKLHQPCGAC